VTANETGTLQHVAVGIVGDGKEMRRHLVAPFALVPVNDALRVDRNASIRVDDHAEQTGIRLQPHRKLTHRYSPSFLQSG